MALSQPLVTGYGSTGTRRTVLVHLVGEDGAEGWGEAAALDHPFYLPDTTSGTFAVTAEWALPLSLDCPADARSVAARLAAIRGNTFAKSGVESAFWCLEAARCGVSMAQLFAAEAGAAVQAGAGEGTPPAIRDHVPAGATIGIHPDVESTLAAVRRAVGKGYRRVKLKVEPGWDEAIVAPVREGLGPEVLLQVDANGSYTLADEDLGMLERLDAYSLACIEQPLGWDDLDGHARLQARLTTPICLDECLRSAADVRRAIEMGACRNVNLKPGRVGGIVESLAVHRFCQEARVPLWCGGMLESGIGRASNLALCALPGFDQPADISPPLERYRYDLVDPTYRVQRDGTVAVPDAPGLGFQVATARISEHTIRRVEVAVGSGRR